jgi:sarcosine oxidase
MVYDVIVVGLGAHGSAAARHLAGRGLSVLGLDRHTPPHTLGSTHGGSRALRLAYHEHRLYVPLVQRALALWRELEAETGRSLFTQSGVLLMGPPESDVLRGAASSADLHGLTCERLTAAEIAARWPAFRPTSEMIGIFEADAGYLNPEACVTAHLELAAAAGAHLRYAEAVHSWQRQGDDLVVATEQGEYRGRHLVIAAGPWCSELLATAAPPLQIERQLQLWFAPAEAQPALADCPVYLFEDDRGRHFYGFPLVDGVGVKVALHHEGALTTMAELQRRVDDAADVAPIRTLLQRFLPAANGPLLRTAVCMYTNTPDGHFLIDHHPGDDHVLVLSPCSGHGFKFAAAVGEVAAQLVCDGRAAADLSLFRWREDWP